MTEYKRIPGLLNNYSISNNGQLRNDKTGRILKPQKSKLGYIYYHLTYGHFYAHRLVAMAYLPSPPNDGNKYEIDHIDHNKENNHVSNLQWITHGENVQRSFNKGIRHGTWKGKKRNPFSKETIKKMSRAKQQSVYVYNTANSTMKECNSVQGAAKYLGISRVYLYIIMRDYRGYWKDYYITKTKL